MNGQELRDFGQNFIRHLESLLDNYLEQKPYSQTNVDTCQEAFRDVSTKLLAQGEGACDISKLKFHFFARIDRLVTNSRNSRANRDPKLFGPTAAIVKQAFGEIAQQYDPGYRPSGGSSAHTGHGHKGDDTLQRVFQETKHYAVSKHRDFKADQMIDGTRVYELRTGPDGVPHLVETNPATGTRQIARIPSAPSGAVQTKYSVVNTDSFTAAEDLKTQGCLKPLVLNMANKRMIGGGAEIGSRAQEEDLFRCSNYAQALYPLAKPNARGAMLDFVTDQDRREYREHIPEFGSVYTPGVTVFRDSGANYTFRDLTTPKKPFKIDCIAVAGYDLRDRSDIRAQLEPTVAGSRRENLQPGREPALLEAFKEGTKNKIRSLLEVAILQGHDSLVLGAISCGAFKLPGDPPERTASAVANAYLEVLQEPRYRNHFKAIQFAILTSNPATDLNHGIFSDMVRKLTQQQKRLQHSLGNAPAPDSADGAGSVGAEENSLLLAPKDKSEEDEAIEAYHHSWSISLKKETAVEIIHSLVDGIKEEILKDPVSFNEAPLEIYNKTTVNELIRRQAQLLSTKNGQKVLMKTPISSVEIYSESSIRSATLYVDVLWLAVEEAKKVQASGFASLEDDSLQLFNEFSLTITQERREAAEKALRAIYRGALPVGIHELQLKKLKGYGIKTVLSDPKSTQTTVLGPRPTVKGYDPRAEQQLGRVKREVFQRLNRYTGFGGSVRQSLGVPNTGPTGENSGVMGDQIGYPKMPVIHPYHPTERALSRNGIPTFSIAARFPSGTLNNLPSGVMEQLTQHNIALDKLEVFWSVQNRPWDTDEELLFRPHPWLHPNAPKARGAAQNSDILVSICAVDAKMPPVASVPGISTHPDAAGEMVYSGNQMPILGLENTRESHAFYSLCIDPPTGRAALSLHWLLNAADHSSIIDLATQSNNQSFRDLYSFISGMLDAESRILTGQAGTTCTPLQALHALMQGGQPEPNPQAHPYQLGQREAQLRIQQEEERRATAERQRREAEARAEAEQRRLAAEMEAARQAEEAARHARELAERQALARQAEQDVEQQQHAAALQLVEEARAEAEQRRLAAVIEAARQAEEAARNARELAERQALARQAEQDVEQQHAAALQLVEEAREIARAAAEQVMAAEEQARAAAAHTIQAEEQARFSAEQVRLTMADLGDRGLERAQAERQAREEAVQLAAAQADVARLEALLAAARATAAAQAERERQAQEIAVQQIAREEAARAALERALAEQRANEEAAQRALEEQRAREEATQRAQEEAQRAAAALQDALAIAAAVGAAAVLPPAAAPAPIMPDLGALAREREERERQAAAQRAAEEIARQERERAAAAAAREQQAAEERERQAAAQRAAEAARAQQPRTMTRRR